MSNATWFLFVFINFHLFAIFAEEQATLFLQLPRDVAHRYEWKIKSSTESKGFELGQPLEMLNEKEIAMQLHMQGLEPKGTEALAAMLRFDDLRLLESRSINKANRTQLEVSRNAIKLDRDGKIEIDSRNDIGLDRITDYQKQMRSLAESQVRLAMEKSGKQLNLQGEKALMKVIRAGAAESLFPVLPGVALEPGKSWGDRFTLPEMGDCKLDEPAVVLAKMTFVRWENRGGVRQAYIEILSAWESKDLFGQNENGLVIKITELDGRGGGIAYFDPVRGVFTEAFMSYQLTYRIHGRRDEDRTDLQVGGKNQFSFKLLDAIRAAGPQPGQ